MDGAVRIVENILQQPDFYDAQSGPYFKTEAHKIGNINYIIYTSECLTVAQKLKIFTWCSFQYFAFISTLIILL